MNASVTRIARLCGLFALAGALLILWTGAAAAQRTNSAADSRSEWPQFLGPQRNGISTETGLLDQWPTDGPKEVWRVPGGVGMSGLVIIGGRVVTLVQKEAQQQLVALDSKTGKGIWETTIASEYKNQQGDGPRATPTIHGDLVFAFSGLGTLAVANLATGKVLWTHNVVADLRG